MMAINNVSSTKDIVGENCTPQTNPHSIICMGMMSELVFFFPNPCSILGTVQTLWSPYFCGVFGMLRVLDRWTEFVQTRLHADTQLSCSFSFLFSSLGDACAFGTSCSLVGTQACAHGVLSWTPSSTRSLESVDLTPILGAGAPRNHL